MPSASFHFALQSLARPIRVFFVSALLLAGPVVMTPAQAQVTVTIPADLIDLFNSIFPGLIDEDELEENEAEDEDEGENFDFAEDDLAEGDFDEGETDEADTDEAGDETDDIAEDDENGDTDTPDTTAPAPTDPIATAPQPTVTTPVPASGADDAFVTTSSTARFLTQATFGPTESDILLLTSNSASQWLVDQFNTPASLVRPVQASLSAVADAAIAPTCAESDPNCDPDEPLENAFFDVVGAAPYIAFWNNAISAPDQLRQRMAFALSQIFVVSGAGGDFLGDTPDIMATYMDVLNAGAFGNYRDLMEAITYQPAMGYWLTYWGNQKGDPTTGRVPDENYAREIMQLFTIGLVMLNMDGTEQLDANGQAIETYTNSDVTGLARVFTGLSIDCPTFTSNEECADSDPEAEIEEYNFTPYTIPMKAYPEFHSSLEKSFLGTTIPANTGPTESITLALDTIFNHQNVPPFVARQLIQRFTTSNPAPDYIERVATAFANGAYTLPNGTIVGDGRRGDLQATIAAVLFDSVARSDTALADIGFGKIREPVIRFTNWARAFSLLGYDATYSQGLYYTRETGQLSQQAYQAPSVFNFYRPGYVAPGTLSGAAGMTVPELQIVNAASTPGYVNFMNNFIIGDGADFAWDTTVDGPLPTGVTEAELSNSFVPDYTTEVILASDAVGLVDRLNSLLVYGSMSDETRQNIVQVVNQVPEENGSTRVHLAIMMTMTSPDYLVQR